MLMPSGSAWMTSRRAPVAPRISGPTTDPDPFAASRTRWSPRASIDPGQAAGGGRGSRRGGRRRRPSGRDRRSPAPGSSSVRQMSASSSSSTASSSLSPAESRTLSPLSAAGLCEAETMIPAANGPSPAMNARAGVGTTPTTCASTPRLVAPATMADTNMSPDRRVSCPTTIDSPRPASRCATARPRAKASVGLRSTLATPRMPSVPNRRDIGLSFPPRATARPRSPGEA